MAEAYRKRGSVIRYENGIVVRVRESGESIEDGVLFRCKPLSGKRLEERSGEDLLAFVDRVRTELPNRTMQRFVALDGFAEHEFDGKQWTETQRRVHLTLVSSSLRVIVDDGTFDAARVLRIAAALDRAGPPQPPPPRLRLAGGVAAALAPSLIGIAGANCVIEQVPGGVDGKGRDIIRTSGPEWPNWYRPSYRIRPQRMPINLALRCNESGAEPALPKAIALLAPPERTTLHVLCERGAEVFPTRINVARVEGCDGEESWHPVGSGVWASETVVVSG